MARPAEYYVDLGQRAIVELLDQEHAAVWHEIEAKISDRRWHTLPLAVDPHHLTTARQILGSQGRITTISAPTRGGRVVPAVTPADTRDRRRAIQDAAGRKRMLQARYLGWASGTKTGGPGVIGPAGEAVVHASLTAAAPHGYRLINPQGGEARHILGAPVPGGPLDNAAFLTLIDSQTNAPQGSPYLVLIEVKNLRSWIYPSTQELHQLLDKAARLQQAHPDQRFVPVLVCRKAHYLTRQMAEELGFYTISTGRQYIRPHVAQPDRTPLDEVRTELGYDLEPHDEEVTPMVRHFTMTLQSVAERTADHWHRTSRHLGPYYSALRDESLSYSERAETLDDLAASTHALSGTPPQWHRKEDR